MVFKAMFRARGETPRVDIADAMGRKCDYDLKLGTQFSEAIGGMRYCLKIRNQYSHCQWHDDYTGTLGFVEFEKLARSNEPVANLSSLTPRYVSLDILRAPP